MKANKIHYQEVKEYFNSASAHQQRGNTLNSGLMAYAAHLLERISPKQGAKLLDVGCGDGLPMAMMRQMRPDLTIDGIDLSDTLAIEARKNNPESNIFVGNVMDQVLPKNSYDAIFSFSVIQYIKSSDYLNFQQSLVALVVGNRKSVIVHCSIPDIRMRAVHFAEFNFRNHGLHGWWRTPAHFIYSLIRHGNKYRENCYWHNPHFCQRQINEIGKTEILPADVYYRFDVKTTISSSINNE